jgi:outer membrane protein assembly factor BamB
MQVEASPSPITQDPAPALPRPSSPRRLWIAVAMVALFWGLFFIVAQIEKPYFIGFLYSMASAALLVLPFFVWWWTNRGILLAQRSAGFALVIGAGVVIFLVCHKSMWFALPTIGLPAVLATWALWMLVVRATGTPWNWPGAVAVIALTWSYFALIRFDGADSELEGDIHWRWEPTAEQRLIAKRAAAAQARSVSEATPTRSVSEQFPRSVGERAGSAVPVPEPATKGPALRQGPGDWVGFRGPGRDGVIHGTNIATNWKASPPKLRWRQEVGPAWSSVVVIGDRLFTQEQLGDMERVVCYAADTGKELWAVEDATRFEETVSGAGPRATPTFADGRLYTLGGTGTLSCLDAAVKKRCWSRDVAAEAGAKPPMWGYCSSPLVVDGLVIVFAGGKNNKGLLAYHCDSGKLAWSAAAGSDSYSSPQLTTIGGRPQCLMLSDAGLFAVDPATGTILWQHGIAMPGAPRSAQPHMVADGQLTVATLEGIGMAMMHVGRDGSNWKTDTVWTTGQMKPEFPDYVVHQGHIYGFDLSTFCCLDAATGERCWRDGRYGRGQVMLLADQSLLLVVTEKTGEVVLLAANPQQHQELGRLKAIKGKTWNHPVIARGRLYLRNATEMACYELPTRKSGQD